MGDPKKIEITYRMIKKAGENPLPTALSNI